MSIYIDTITRRKYVLCWYHIHGHSNNHVKLTCLHNTWPGDKSSWTRTVHINIDEFYFCTLMNILSHVCKLCDSSFLYVSLCLTNNGLCNQHNFTVSSYVSNS